MVSVGVVVNVSASAPRRTRGCCMNRNCTVQFHFVSSCRLAPVVDPERLGPSRALPRHRSATVPAARLQRRLAWTSWWRKPEARRRRSTATSPRRKHSSRRSSTRSRPPAVNDDGEELGGRRAGGRVADIGRATAARGARSAHDPAVTARHRRARPVPAPRDDLVRARRSRAPTPASAASWPPGEQQVTSTSTICRSPPSSSSAGSSATSNSALRSACRRRPARTSKPGSRQRSGPSSPANTSPS